MGKKTDMSEKTRYRQDKGKRDKSIQDKGGQEKSVQGKSVQDSSAQEHRRRRGLFRQIQRLKNRIALNRKQFILYTVLRSLVILTMIRCFFLREYENVGLCILSLALFLLPSLAEDSLNIKIPVFFESIIYLFIYSSWIMGEIQHYYIRIPGWDTMLHTMNGFLCAAVGFSLVELLNHESSKIQLSPIYVAIVAFCFSMTVGVIWEFIEFSFDQTLFLDMQKDTIAQTIGTVKLNASPKEGPMKISGIEKTVMYLKNGQTVTVEGGYLDIGLIDTMKDLFVNLIGAIAFSIIGYNFISRRSENSIAPELYIRYETPEEKQQIGQALDMADQLTYREKMSKDAKVLFRGETEEQALMETEEGVSKETPGTTAKADHAGDAAEAVRHLQSNTVVTAWVSVLFACAGIILLYPLGDSFLNLLFLFDKVCIIAGIFTFLFAPPQKRTKGLWLWTLASIMASLFSLYRWMLLESLSWASVRIYVVSVFADLGLPIILWRMYRREIRLQQGFAPAGSAPA